MKKLITLWLFGLFIISGAAWYIDAVAGDMLSVSIRFMIQFTTIIMAIGLVIWLLVFGWIAIERGRTASERRREARAQRVQAEAEALKADREARLTITIAPPGYQVYTHEVSDTLIHRPLHLSPNRLNGIEIIPNPSEQQRWAVYNLAHATAKAAAPTPAGSTPPLLPAGENSQIELPNLVRWFDLVPGYRGNLDKLVLGVRVNEAGQLAPVTISLYELFHTIIAASSGWGKSAFVRSILTQLATSPQLVELVLIDQQEHGLAAFKNCDRLRYPLLREPGEILSALREVYEEAIHHRSELFARYDADDLEDYNRLADASLRLSPVVVAVDEASALLASDKEIAAELKRQAWELRKFGVYQILCLTSAKGTTIDTDHRQQFSSKIQMHANDRYQARLLLDAPEAVTFPQGRAVIDLPGQLPMIVQTPYIRVIAE